MKIFTENKERNFLLLSTRKRPLAIELLSVFLAPIPRCESRGRQQMIEQSFLQNNLKIGQVLLVSSVAKVSAETGRALSPHHL